MLGSRPPRCPAASSSGPCTRAKTRRESPASFGWKRAAELTEDQRAGREAAVQSPYVCGLALLEKRNRGSAEGVTVIPTEAEVMLFPVGQVCQEKLPFALPERGEEE